MAQDTFMTDLKVAPLNLWGRYNDRDIISDKHKKSTEDAVLLWNITGRIYNSQQGNRKARPPIQGFNKKRAIEPDKRQ